MGKIKKIIEKNPKKFKRTLFFSLIALFLLAFIFLPNVVLADWIGDLMGSEMHARDISQLIKTISHIVYVFIWPCLAIAGAALDNSLIYGSFLHLDAALWNVWNIMKNFANFALWFIFIFTIVRNLFAWSFGGSTYDPVQGAKKVIEKTLISWVLVQMSWFIVAALIDLSTILIYAVWGIPLSMLWSYDNNVADVPIMKLNVVMEDDQVPFSYYSYWWHNYSPCLVANKQWDVKEPLTLQWWLTWEYIVWRERLYMSDQSEFESWYCSLNGYLYKYKESVGYTWYASGTNQEYLNSFVNYLSSGNMTSWEVFDKISNCYFISAYTKEYTWADGQQCVEVCPGYWQVSYTWDVFSGTTDGFRLKDLMENSKWWVWPFVTMYSSILNYQDLVMNPDSESVVWNLFGFIINTFFALILFLPIWILMVLLIIRIGFLWIVVAISPILVLVNFGPVWDKIKNNDLLKKFEIKEILKQIFLPVVVVFAVSMCIVFLSTLYKSKPNYDDASQTLSAFWIEKVSSQEVQWSGCIMTWRNMTNETYSILWLVTVRINAQNYNHWKDIFVWVLMELLATWIVWFFMKTAINLMSEKWKKFMSTAEKFVTTIPLIQLPGVEWKVWLQAFGIGEWNKNEIIENLNSRVMNIQSKQDEALRRRFSSDDEDNSSSSSSVSVADAIAQIIANPSLTYDKMDKKYRDALASAWYKESDFADLSNTVRGGKYQEMLQAWENLKTPTKDMTNADALIYSRAELDVAVRSDPNWIRRAVVWLRDLYKLLSEYLWLIISIERLSLEINNMKLLIDQLMKKGILATMKKL